jgi:hypothetical protein
MIDWLVVLNAVSSNVFGRMSCYFFTFTSVCFGFHNRPVLPKEIVMVQSGKPIVIIMVSSAIRAVEVIRQVIEFTFV